MLPRWHIFLGALFTLAIWMPFPSINPLFPILVFLSSFLIDFDHYLASVNKTGKLSLKNSFEYHRKAGIQERREHKLGIRKKSDFHLFHTIEFHILIGLIGIFIAPFFFIFLGMIFHSMLDLFDLSRRGMLYRIEYFFFNWLKQRL